MIKNILLYGGAFNPITIGHTDTALYAINNCNKIEEVWFMPCYKSLWGKEMATPQHRLNMIQLALEETKDKRLKVFPFEIEEKLEGGTIDILKHLFDKFPPKNYNFYFLIGMDHANVIEQWKESKQLLEMVKIIVVNRCGVKRNSNRMWFDQEPHIFVEGEKPYPTNTKISSTIARVALENSEHKNSSYLWMLHSNIINYIAENKLYKY